MTTYRGNTGNLLQHWVFCELVEELRSEYGDGAHLHYFDAHSMVPLARPDEHKQDRRFQAVAHGLPGRSSTYERCWRELTRGDPGAYPSSATFLVRLWPGPLSLSLCEIDPETCTAIAAWAASGGIAELCRHFRLYPCDWRRVTPEWSETADLRLLQFDPYRYNANRDQRTRRGGSLYPQDLEIIGRMTGAAERPTVILASSYSAQNNNPVRRIEASLRKGLEPYGFDLRHRVEANGNMVAFVLTRSLPDLEPLDELEQRFQSWLKAVTDKTVAG